MNKFIAGLIAGASLGVLFAPEKGSKTRKKLAESEQKLADFGSHLLEAGKEASTEVKTFLEKKEVKEFIQKGKGQVSDLLEKGKELSTKGQEELKKIWEDTSEKRSKTIEDVKKIFSKREEEK